MNLPNQQRDLFADMPCREAGVVIEQEWNERYAGSNQIWSGQPNQALVTEVSELPPARALDVGCGEGGTRFGSPSGAGMSPGWTCPGWR